MNDVLIKVLLDAKKEYETLLDEVWSYLTDQERDAALLLKALRQRGPIWNKVLGFVKKRFLIGNNSIWEMLDAGSIWNEDIETRFSGFNNCGYFKEGETADEIDQEELASMIIEGLCWSYDERENS